VKNLEEINRMKGRIIRLMVREPLARFSPVGPVYVFHHIPKCGGSSMQRVLARWFLFVPDYHSELSKVDLHRLRSAHCLAGHYDVDGYYLHQRYPEVLTSDRFRLITFLRDPLQARLSLYRYQKKINAGLYNKVNKLEDHIFWDSNYLAGRFPATPENYKEVIDRYFFVGILEQAQASLDLLAHMIRKPTQKFPWENATRGGLGTASDELSDELVARFRAQNSLDYLIYDYSVQKFREKLVMWNSVKDHKSVSLAPTSDVGVL
jgi:hypothetical protein